jgi:dTDP-4-dehydrorhamnose reductase
MNILVTGGNGQLGSEIRSLANNFPSFNFLFTDAEELNITEETAVQKFFSENTINVCINCAAYTAVDKAESEKEMAFLVNAKAVEYLSKACTVNCSKLIHISTDFVFDGTIARPILETDIPNPLSVYGATKLSGEEFALQFSPDAIVLRTSWVYSSFGNNFVKTILRLCKEKPSLNIIYDQVGTPTYARDLAQAILQIVADKNSLTQKGIFNFSNEGVCSWYDFAIAIRNLASLETPIFPIETIQYPTPATRPQYSVLSKQKFKTAFNQSIPYWQDSLKDCFAKLS